MRICIEHMLVKSCCRSNLQRASVFNFELLDMLWDSIRLPNEKLLSFELAMSFGFKFRACRYITGLNRTSEWKVIVVRIFSELLFSILRVSICYGTQSDSRVKSYCPSNSLRASVLSFQRLDILRDSIEHPSKTLLSFEFATSFCCQFWASQYVTGLNRTSELKVIVVRICCELRF